MVAGGVLSRAGGEEFRLKVAQSKRAMCCVQGWQLLCSARAVPHVGRSVFHRTTDCLGLEQTLKVISFQCLLWAGLTQLPQRGISGFQDLVLPLPPVGVSKTSSVSCEHRAGSQVGASPRGRQVWMSPWLLGASGMALAQVEEVQPL